MEPTVLHHFVNGQWQSPEGNATQEIKHAIHGNVHALSSSAELNWKEVLAYGRSVGNASLRSMTFQERGRMLKALALHLHSQKELFYQMSEATGATRADSWIDIEGGIGNLICLCQLAASIWRPTICFGWRCHWSQQRRNFCSEPHTRTEGRCCSSH